MEAIAIACRSRSLSIQPASILKAMGNPISSMFLHQGKFSINTVPERKILNLFNIFWRFALG